MRIALILAAALLAAAAPASAATPAEDFSKLLKDHYTWLLRTNPVQATALGVRNYDDRIRDLSPEARARHVEEAKALLARLERIPSAQLAAGDRTNHAILKRMLGETVEAALYPQRSMLFTTYSGWHQGFASMAGGLPFSSRRDYESYLKRIEQYPKLNDQALKITAEAVAGGHVLPCSVLPVTRRRSLA